MNKEEFNKLNNQSKTLFITLLGKANMSKKGLFLSDYKAEEITSDLESIKELKQSKWLSMYMGLRSSIIDNLTDEYLLMNKDTTIIHLGCGLDSRVNRIKNDFYKWYDIDFESVIDLRKKYYSEDNKYQMIGKEINDVTLLDNIEVKDNVVVVLEGLLMYLSKEEIKELLVKINNKFKNVRLIFDSYTYRGVKASKIKNPVNKVKAKIKYGFNKVSDFMELNDNLKYIKSYPIKRKDNELKGMTKFIFNSLYCGKISELLYKIYEFDLGSGD